MLSYYRYRRWDGTQEWSDLDSGEIMDALSEELLAHGDLNRALQNLLRRGMPTSMGRLPGLQDLLQRLRQQREQALGRYDLDSVMDQIKEKLDEVVNLERQGIEQRLETAKEQDPNLQKLLQDVAQRKQSFLDSLPPDAPGKIKSLSDYEFMEPQAHEKFQELLDMLKSQVMESTFQSIQQGLQNMTPEDLERMRQMMADLNRMLQEKMRGGHPDFDSFMQKYGDMFGPNPPQSLDDLIERMQRQRQAMESLMESMSPEQRQSLQEMVQNMIQGMGLGQEAALLAANLDRLMPWDHQPQGYPFQGDESLSLTEAMRLMDQLQGMDELERQLRAAQQGQGLDQVDMDRLQEILGDEAAQNLEELRRLAELLEQAGLVERKGNRFELTPRGLRHIGQKALRDIFGYLKKDRAGKHESRFSGAGVDRAEETKPYEFGDTFFLQLEKTLMNAVFREGQGTPVRLQAQDFEVYRTEYLTQVSTVLMIDLSWSMPLRGNFMAAKKVALALDTLIRGQFPRDDLYLVGFSDYARIMKKEQLPTLTWNEFVYGTNMQHGFMLARKLLSKSKGGTKQIIVITDGEPTAHLEGGRAHFAYPPTMRTLQETLKEVKRCTKEGIIINTFMLERSPYLRDFVDQMTRINKGRAFYTSAEHLGEYILVDYLRNKRQRIT